MVGVKSYGVVKIDRHYDKGLEDLAVEAAVKALDNCNCQPKFLVVANALAETQQDQMNLAPLIAEALDFKGEVYRVEVADASGAAAVALATRLAHEGDVLVIGVEKSTDKVSKDLIADLAKMFDAEYESIYGLTYAGAHALAARLYMNKFGLSREELSLWPSKMHENATKVPHAQLRFPVPPEKVTKSQVIAEPLHLLDAHPFGDGAAALVISKDADNEIFVASSNSPLRLAHRDLTFIESTYEATKVVLEKMGITHEKVEGVEVHDAFSIAGIIALESMGFAERGKGIRLLEEGSLAINPSGGLKARGHPIGATGVYQVAEAVMAIRGELPSVDRLKAVLVQSTSALGATSFVIGVRG